MSGPPANADAVNNANDAIRSAAKTRLFLDMFHPPALDPLAIHCLLYQAHESVHVDRSLLSQNRALFLGSEEGLVDFHVLEQAGIVRLIDSTCHRYLELALTQTDGGLKSGPRGLLVQEENGFFALGV